MKIALHFGVSARRKFSGSRRIDEMAGPAELLEREAELGERAAIEIARGDELVARLHQREEGQELRRMTRRRGDRGAPALERRDPLLEHRHGRVGQPRIDVAEIVQVEERGGVIDVVEHIGRRLIDRGRARAGRRIGRGAGMDRAGLEAVVEIARRRRAALRAPRQRRRRRRGCWMMPLLTPLQDNSPPSRPNSIFGHRFMITSMPAASAVFAAASLRTPSCIHTTLAPMAIASVDDAGRLARRCGTCRPCRPCRGCRAARHRPSRRARCLPAIPGLTGITR